MCWACARERSDERTTLQNLNPSLYYIVLVDSSRDMVPSAALNVGVISKCTTVVLYSAPRS